MSKEQKRDKNGRFAKNVEVDVTVEKPAFKNQKEELEYWKTLAEGYKIALEDISSKYLNKCADCKKLECYERHWDRLFDIALAWRDRAEEEEKKHLFIMDALREAYMQIGWFTNKLSWWTKCKYRDKILDMEMDLDRMVAHAECLDKE